MLIKTFGKVDMFAVVVWGNLFALVPMIVVAGVLEGPTTIVNSVTSMNLLPSLRFLQGWVAIPLMQTDSGWLGRSVRSRLRSICRSREIHWREKSCHPK